MKELDNLILREMVRYMNNRGFLNEDVMAGSANMSEPFDVRDLLPTIKITEDWGKLRTKDRAVIEKFTASLGGEGTDIESKLQKINSIISGSKEGAEQYGVAQILTVMMVLESLGAILGEFTESAGGFIFEGFLAGLFGGQSVQIETAKDVEAATGEQAGDVKGKPITDVVLGGRHYSLKLLGESTAVKGSFRNMVEHFRSYEEVVYLDARVPDGRTTMKFSEFTITLKGFLDVFYEPFKKMRVSSETMTVETKSELEKLLQPEDAGGLGQKIKKMKLSKQFDKKKNVGKEEGLKFADIMAMPEEELNKYGPFTVTYMEEDFGKSVKAKKYFGTAEFLADVRLEISNWDAGLSTKEAVIERLSRTPAYKNNEQFDFTPRQVESIAGFRHIGELTVGPKALQDVWLQYADILKNTIEPVYRNLNEFTRNINGYFLSMEGAEKGSTRFDYGTSAISDAQELKSATDRVVQVGETQSNIEAASEFNLRSVDAQGRSLEETKKKNKKHLEE